MELMVPKTTLTLPRSENCGDQACGTCTACRRKAATAIAAYVIKKRFTERGRRPGSANAEEQQYVRNMVLKLLDMAGLLDEKEVCLDAIKRSDWGAAMRRCQTER